MGYEGNDQAALTSIKHRELTKSMQTLLGICTGISSDNQINDQEIHFLVTWLSQYEDVAKLWPAEIIAQRVKKILSDGKITQDEREHLLDTIKQITGNYFHQTGSVEPETIGFQFDKPIIDFKKAIICLTGEFITGTRNRCLAIIENTGCKISDSVTKKVTHLIVGHNTSPSWKYESFGLKIQKAIELRNNGHPIFIISEQHWIDCIKLAI